MKKLFFTVVMITLFTTFSNAQLDCRKFRNGKFKLVDKELNTTYLITRKGAIQEEQIEGKEGIFTFDVVWTSDCTYVLHPTKESIEKFKVDFHLIVQIIDIKGSNVMLKMYSKEQPDKIFTKEVEFLE